MSVTPFNSGFVRARGSARAWRCVVMGAAVLAVTLASPPALAQSEAAHQQFLFAYKLLQRGEDAMAAEAFDEYLGRFPTDEKRGDALYYRALLDRRAGDDATAARRLADAPAPTIVPGYAVDLLRGQVLADLGRHDEALAALEPIDVSELEPAIAASVHYLRGQTYRRAGNLAAAATQLEAAVALDTPMRPRAMLDLARVQVLRERSGEALQTLRGVLELDDPGVDAEAARLAGDLSYEQGDYEQAVRFYERVVTRRQSSAQFAPAAVGILWSHFSAGRHQAVLEAYEQYGELLPVQDRVAATYLAGSAHVERGEHERAAALLERIAHGDGDHPLHAKTLYKLALSRFELSQDERMADAIMRLLREHPQSPLLVDAAYLLASADARRGNVTRGASRLTQIIDQGEANRYYRPALLRRARLYEEHGKPQLAAADYRRYLEALEQVERQGGEPSGQYAEAALRLIDLLFDAERFAEAERWAQKLADRETAGGESRQEALYRLALARMRGERFEAAGAALDRLDEQFPLHPYRAETRYYRGVLLLALGRGDEAADLLRASAEDERLEGGARAAAWRLLGRWHREAGRSAEAASALGSLAQLAGLEALSAEELLWLGRHRLERVGDDENAWRALRPVAEQAVASEPAQRAEASYLAGRALRALGRYDEARTHFGRVIALGEGYDQEARLELAGVLADTGSYGEAMAELTGLMSEQRGEIAARALYEGAQAQRAMARRHERADEPQRAAEARRQAWRLLKRLVLLYGFAELSPLPQLAYLDMAELSAQLGEVERAGAELDELIERFPDGPFAVYARAVRATDRQRYGEAAALLERIDAASADPRLMDRVRLLREMVRERS